MSTYPRFEISVNQFSADRNHETMTGGTLESQKVITVDEAKYSLYVYHVEMCPFSRDENFHKGAHTLEHYVAYTGGLRDELHALDNNINPKSILDISPEKREGNYSLKISSLTKLENSLLLEALKKAFARIVPQLENTDAVIFANSRQCGQYTYHSKSDALSIIEDGTNLKVTLEEKDFSSKPFINVCDFRLLKPKLEGSETPQHFLDPLVSHALGNYIDVHWQNLKIEGISVSTGVYGCMTGQYIIIASATEIDDAILHKVHEGLMILLEGCAREDTLWRRMQEDVEESLKLYRKYIGENKR